MATKPIFQESDYLKKLNEKKSSYVTPASYTSKLADTKDKLLDQYLNTDIKDYNMDTDPLYQQYANQYKSLGKLAMQDTIGQATQLSGGYNNSFATTAGQQAYNQYLTELNNLVPQLAESHYNRQLNAQNQLANKLATVQSADDSDYARYRDTVADFYTNRDYYTQLAQNQYDQEYNAYLNALSQFNTEQQFDYNKSIDERDFNYRQSRDAVSDAQWQQQLAYQQNRDAVSDSQWQQQFDYQKEIDAADREYNYAALRAKSSSSNSSGSSGSAGTTNADAILNFKNNAIGFIQSAVTSVGTSPKPSKENYPTNADYERAVEEWKKAGSGKFDYTNKAEVEKLAENIIETYGAMGMSYEDIEALCNKYVVTSDGELKEAGSGAKEGNRTLWEIISSSDYITAG